MGKITRVRTGCWTCKKRHKKCDEAKPKCNNCVKSKKECEGYKLRLSFDVDDSRNKNRMDNMGNFRVGFIGKPRLKSETSEVKPASQIKSPHNSSEVSKIDVHQQYPNNNFLGEQHQGAYGPKSESFSPISIDNKSTLDESLLLSIPAELRLMKGKSSPESDLSLTNSMSDIMSYNGIDKLEQVSSDLFQNFEHLLNVPDIDKLLSMDTNLTIFPLDLTPNIIEAEFSKSKLFMQIKLENQSVTDSTMITSYDEENLLLKHFFQKLLPLIDAHPNSPWPDLALKYCDFDIARSCFIALACIHMYESGEAGEEYYHKGVAHINRTMSYLRRFIHSINGAGSSNIDQKKKNVSSLVILMLIHVHFIFAVIETGKSTLSRYLLKVFASICEDDAFCQSLMSSDKMAAIVICLSWCDTISAIASHDYRLPFCSPNWYSSTNNVITTAKMMGCPGEIFKAISRVCFIRHDLKGEAPKNGQFSIEYESIKTHLLRYRDYVEFEDGGGDDYNLRLKGAQCWSIGVLITLNRTVRQTNFEVENRKLVHEFIHVYHSMNPVSPTVTQMVWPVHAVGCECKSNSEKEQLLKIYDGLYKNTQMRTPTFMKEVAQRVWETNLPQEQILAEMLDGAEYLPL